jgi:hypothetical protein
MIVLWAALLGCSGDPPVASAAIGPGPDRPVWRFEKTASGWIRSLEPVAHSVSSLGLGIDDHHLVLTVQCFWSDCGSESKRRTIGPPVHTLSTNDLRTFEAGMIRLVDPDDRVPIDTEYRPKPGGGNIWYYGTVAGTPGDPAAHTAPHGIYKATIQGDRLVNPTRMITGPGLADPAPIQVDGKTFLFLTTVPGRSIGMATGDPLRVTRTWEGVSVPHAMRVGAEIWLWAQRIQNGRMTPVRIRSADSGQTWTDWEAPLPLEGIAGCGNPVGGVFRNTPVVFCVTEAIGAPRP